MQRRLLRSKADYALSAMRSKDNAGILSRVLKKPVRLNLDLAGFSHGHITRQLAVPK
ncbi:hypothetical protein J14TS5_39840 [Paenibacillus lautus]|nr:hypothetical protein J14TS5_39840 [Paenibacillus lautus]